jgi:site-specific DNA-methyltransferase (adenine-specific)
VGKMQKKNTGGKSSNYNDFDAQPKINNLYYPKTIIDIPLPRFKNGHPTQKPVALFEYLIKTYTNEGEIVLDNCIGSGTTAIACINTNRKYIGFEIEKEYYDLAIDRINKHLHTLNKL